MFGESNLFNCFLDDKAILLLLSF